MTPEAIAQEIYGTNYKTISRYVDILATKGSEWGLIGPREVSRLWERHILNSVALSSLIGQGCSLIDVGSGAGLPGIPLAILRPDLDVTLLDSLLRRVTFLTETVGDLGLEDQVRVVRGRAEDMDMRADIVVARAVAPLDRLAHWCTPLLSPHGVILALKGDSASSEVEQSREALTSLRLDAEVLRIAAHPHAEATTVVRLRRQ